MKSYLVIKIYFPEDISLNYTILRQTLEGFAKKIENDAELVDYALIRQKTPAKKKGAKPPRGVIAIYQVNIEDERVIDKVHELLEGKKQFKWVKDYSVLLGLTTA